MRSSRARIQWQRVGGCHRCVACCQVCMFGKGERLGMKVDGESGAVLQVENGASLHASLRTVVRAAAASPRRATALQG